MKKLMNIFMLLVIVSLAACGPAATTVAPTVAPTTAPTTAPATAAPTKAPATVAPTTAPTTAPTKAQATTAPTAAPTQTKLPTVPAKPGAIEIAFWHGQSGTQETALSKLVNEFNTANPGIHVTATYQGTYSDLYKKATSAIAAGAPPDLTIAYQNDVSNYIKSDAVIALDDLIADKTVGLTADDLKDIFPSFIDHYAQYGGKVYSMAFMRSMEVMYYNADMLTAAGFKTPPANWDDFMKVCAAVSKPPDQYCYELNTDASRFATWIWSRGGDLLSADGKTAAFNSQAGVDTMQYLSDLFTKKYAIVIAKAYQDQTDFSLGKIAFAFGSSAGLPYYKSAIDQAGKVKSWAIAPSPYATKNPVVDLYGPSVAIFKTTAEKQKAAFTFLKWLMSKEANAEWVQATSYFPARASTKDALADFIAKNPLYGSAYAWLQYGKNEPTTAAWNPIRGFVADAMTAVINGKATPKEALDAAAQKANDALAAQ